MLFKMKYDCVVFSRFLSNIARVNRNLHKYRIIWVKYPPKFAAPLHILCLILERFSRAFHVKNYFLIYNAKTIIMSTGITEWPVLYSKSVQIRILIRGEQCDRFVSGGGGGNLIVYKKAVPQETSFHLLNFWNQLKFKVSSDSFFHVWPLHLDYPGLKVSKIQCLCFKNVRVCY